MAMAAVPAVALMAAPLTAQSANAANALAQAAPKYNLDVSFSYNATLADAITSSSFWMQGGSAEVHGRFYRGLGAVADVTGMHTAGIGSSSVGLDLVTATFGPRYTWSPAHRRYALFGQALVGKAFGFNSVFPAASGATASQNSLAVNLGGGMNVVLTPHLALRAFEADWLRTQLPNSTTNAQNNLRLGAGIVFRFR
jgi:hypothetical protein